jgi:hypothetical protein
MQKIILLVFICIFGFGYTPPAKIEVHPKVVHVLVALCDNTYQSIVPVPAKIGNGQDPDRNLYWGCGFGVRTYFKKSAEWKFIRSEKIDSINMERLVFKHVTKNIFLVADAYNGKYIKKCTEDLLNACAGKKKDTLRIGKTVIGLFGNSQLLAYIGHDGLMDFELQGPFDKTDKEERDCIILACVSKTFFGSHLRATGARPLLWTTGLMCPEAYTLHDALSGWVVSEPAESIRSRAAKAYSKYQKCSEKAARNLLVTGY